MKTDTKFHTEFLTEDVHLVGFLLLPRYDFTVSYQMNWSGKIAATIKGDPAQLKQALADLQNNTLVGSKDLIESIKKVRREIFEKKNGAKETKEK